MQIIGILKRRDASSVLVAIVLAGLVSQLVERWTEPVARLLSGTTALGGGWKGNFWYPLFMLVVGVIVLELVIRVYTVLTGSRSVRNKL